MNTFPYITASSTASADADSSQRIVDQFQRRAMLVSLSISMWTGSKEHRIITSEVAELHSIEHGHGRYRVQVLKRWPELDSLKAALRKLRQQHYALTLPWSAGLQMLPVKQHAVWLDAVHDVQQRLEHELKPACRQTYQQAIDADRQRLGDAFSESDYMPVDELLERFSIDVTQDAVPDVTDIRLEVSDAVRDDIAKQMLDRLAGKATASMQAAWQRIHDVLRDYADAMQRFNPQASDKRTATFRDSTVTKVLELVDVLPALNVTDDPALYQMADELSKALAADAGTLRSDTAIRQQAAQDAERLAQQASQHAGTAAASGII